jgi:DTW domain-containing protein
MGSRRHVKAKCPDCLLHENLCICHLTNPIEVRTKLVLLIHYIEERKSTNTGKLATVLLKNSQCLVRGKLGEPVNFDGVFSPDRETIVLFPYEDAKDLTPDLVKTFKKPVTLVVPDGTWRQAWKMVPNEPLLAGLPKYKLPEGGAPTRYKLRHEHRADGLATFEAIARAIGLFEGENVQRKLESVFDEKIQRMLYSRGQPSKYRPQND